MKRHLQAMFVRDIPTISRYGGGHGTGTVVLGATNPFGARFANTGLDWRASMYGLATPAFYDIKDADAVYEMVSQLRNQQTAT